MVRRGFSAVLLRRLALPSSLLLVLILPALTSRHELRFPKQPVPPGTVKSASSIKPLFHPTPYALRPQLRAKALRYSRTQYAIYFGGVALSLSVFTVLWLGGFGTCLRRIAGKTSQRLFVQCLVFVPVFWTMVSAIQFPLDYYSGFTVEHHFGLSNQGIPSWLADWAKTFAITVVVMIFVVWAFYRIVHRSPKRWWLFFWLALIPPALFIMFIEPYVVEPLYFRFTPLEKSDPLLTATIERMLEHAGLKIPESRIYEMNASAKTRTLNAYVSGFGASARVVIWDTTLRDLTADETLSVLGHETGHYALHHVIKEFVLDELLALGWFYIGFLVLGAVIKRKGPTAGIEGTADLASLPFVMLILTAILFLSSPMYCAISRHYEHQADEYGLEVTYGILPDPNAAMVRSFQTLEADDLADPDPNPFIVFWLYTHPPIAARIRFADHYKPWAHGQPLKLLQK
ncbi:MAG TPA: M48 family metallopeptidase [Terriglobia bacterium]|nr:M48 family metallopeptidase [Terriglobia bacterium]